MRETSAIVLTFLLVFQSMPVFGQDAGRDPRLRALLADLPDEAGRFSKTHPLSDATDSLPSQSNAANDGRAAVREKIRKAPKESRVTVKLRDGTTVEGLLASVGDESFGLKVEADETTRRQLGLERGARVERQIRYEDVVSIDVEAPKSKAHFGPEWSYILGMALIAGILIGVAQVLPSGEDGGGESTNGTSNALGVTLSW